MNKHMTNKEYSGFGPLVLVALAVLSAAQQSYSQATTANARLIISFTSVASGVDRKAVEEIGEFIASYEKEKGVQLAKEVASWGREGECDYCLKLSELSEEE